MSDRATQETFERLCVTKSGAQNAVSKNGCKKRHSVAYVARVDVVRASVTTGHGSRSSYLVSRWPARYFKMSKQM